MLQLNLTNNETSHIKWEVSSFPDGQQDILLKDIKPIFKNDSSTVEVLSRFNGFRDLELIVCAVKALRREGVKKIDLYIPYLLGARSDRQFQEGGTSYLVDVVAPILNSLQLNSVHVMDAHSDVAAACINNFRGYDNSKLVKFAVFSIDNYSRNPGNYVLVSPDAGASKKIQKIADSIGYTGDIITCSKTRGVDGKLTNTVVPISSTITEQDFIIIDDICDGGATFLNIVKAIRAKQYVNNKIYLIVTHGIFSKGVDCMNVFEKVFITNSIKDLGADNMDAYSPKKHNIIQLNIF